MKINYLNELRLLLDKYRMSIIEKDDIINDYSEMYDNWLDYGMKEDEVEDKLGEPDNIIIELVEGYKTVAHASKVKTSSKNSKLIAITPFISLVAFFIIGFGYNGWIYGWMAFLLIPISAIFLEMKQDSHRLTALMPFISLIAFFVLGFVYNLWHPGWLVFISIPLVAIFTERKKIGFLNTLVSLSPLVITVVFLYIGLEYNVWTPTWCLFLIIPALGVLNEKSKLRMFIWEVLIIGGVLSYLYFGYTFDEWGYALFSFVPLVAFGILIDNDGILQMDRKYKLVSLLAVLAFFALGFITKQWGYVWIVFLSIPVYAILTETKGNERTIAITPFIAVVIFFTLGWFFGLWAYAWLAFLIIPVVAIIKEG